jgi:hypothetical protein
VVSHDLAWLRSTLGPDLPVGKRRADAWLQSMWDQVVGDIEAAFLFKGVWSGVSKGAVLFCWQHGDQVIVVAGPRGVHAYPVLGLYSGSFEGTCLYMQATYEGKLQSYWLHPGVGLSEQRMIAVVRNYLRGLEGEVLDTGRGLTHRPQPVTTDYEDDDSPEAPPRPEPRLVRTAHEAELTVAEWVTYMGFGPATVTPIGADSGLDVIAEHAVAQVKMEGIPTGRPAVQGLVGAATGSNKRPLFFSLAGYTKQAVAWADSVDLPLFTFDLQGEPVPVNHSGALLLD